MTGLGPPRPRGKDYALALYCLSVDWLGALGWLYQDGHPGPASWVGEHAQGLMHSAHNNRLFRRLAP